MQKKRSERWLIIGIPILFLIGSLLHFLYTLSGKNRFIGAFVPVNESVWEHLKMVPIPVILWWSVYYLLRGKKDSIDPNNWFTGLLVALFSALFTIPLFYYFYTEAFGVEWVIVDVLILLAALLIGQWLGLTVLRHANSLPYPLSLAIIASILAFFVLFTFHPPHLPLFLDRSTGKFGMG